MQDFDGAIAAGEGLLAVNPIAMAPTGRSVDEMIQALQGGGAAGRSPAQRPAARAEQPSVSELRTVAVGSPVAQVEPKTVASVTANPTVGRTRVVRSSRRRSAMDNPLIVVAMFLGAMVLAGFGAFVPRPLTWVVGKIGCFLHGLNLATTVSIGPGSFWH